MPRDATSLGPFWLEIIVAVSMFLPELLPAQFATRSRICLATDKDLHIPPMSVFSAFVLRRRTSNN